MADQRKDNTVKKDKIIEIVNLTREFEDGVVAVDDISFLRQKG